jgi:hypothetical protein
MSRLPIQTQFSIISLRRPSQQAVEKVFTASSLSVVSSAGRERTKRRKPAFAQGVESDP